MKSDVIKSIDIGPYNERVSADKVVFFREPTSYEALEIFVYKHGNQKLNAVTTISDAAIRSAKNIERYKKSELISDISECEFEEASPETFERIFDEVVRERVSINILDVGEVLKVWVLVDEYFSKILFCETSVGYIWFRWECSA